MYPRISNDAHSDKTWSPAREGLPPTLIAPGAADADDRITLGLITIGGPGIGALVRESLTREVRRVLCTHGIHAFEAPKSAAAIHEAGHAVVAHGLCGERITQVRIWPDPLGWGGVTKYASGSWQVKREDDPVVLITKARHIYAGVAAEMMFEADFRQGSSLDEVAVSQLLGGIAANILGVDAQTYWNAEVHDKVCQYLAANAATAYKIGNYLIAHRKMQGRPLELALAGVRP